MRIRRYRNKKLSCVSYPITLGVRAEGVDVVIPEEDGTKRLPDPELLQRVTDLGRVMFSRDSDLLREAHRRQAEEIFFAGVIYAHQLQVSIGRCIHDLVLMATLMEPEELANRVYYLPL